MCNELLIFLFIQHYKLQITNWSVATKGVSDLGNYFYSQAFNNLDNPFWACHYNNEKHPKYHRCEICPSLYECDLIQAVEYREKSEEEEKSFENPEDFDPYWACLEGDTSHPLYHKCGRCCSYWKCAARDEI